MKRGDSLVEVMLAIALLGAVVVGIISIMNYSHANLQASLDRTRVQALMEAQLDAVRYARDQFVLNVPSPNPGRDLWTALATRIHSAPPNATVCADNSNSSWPGAKFAIVKSGAGFTVPAVAVAQRKSDLQPQPGNGLWVELGQNGEFIEATAKACWSSLKSAPDQEAKIVVRLVDPR